MTRAFVAIGLLLLFGPTVSASPSPDLASFLNSLGASGSCPSPMQTAAGGDKGDPGGITAFSTCEANCSPYSNVSCSGDTCSAVDRNCSAGQRGYVQCDGVTTYCPVCDGCPEGHIEWRESGCCQGGWLKYRIYECINGTWQQIDTFCDQVSCF